MFGKSLRKTPEAALLRKSDKYQLTFMILYIIFIYLPYYVMIIASPYDILTTSLSNIAWKLNGFPLIILYGTLTLPFLLFEIYFYLKFNKQKKDILKWSLISGCLLLGVGICFPNNGSWTLISLHCSFSEIGAGLTMLSITGIIIRYCKRHKEDKKSLITKIALVYGVFLIPVAATLILAGTPALFEVGSTFIFMIILYCFNVSSVREFLQEQGGNKSDSISASGAKTVV